MNKLWLIFAQSVTVLLAIFFVVSTLRPELLPWTPRGKLATVKEAVSIEVTPRPSSFYTAAEIAMPSVVNIFTSKEVKVPSHPLLDDPMFQRFFGERFESRPRRSSSLAQA